MNNQLIEVRNTQRNSWNTFSPGWKKWDNFTMQFLHDQGTHIIDSLDLNRSARVLDIASGTGEPGLTIAAKVLKNGSVTAIDLSDKMLSIAERKAAGLGIRNYETQVADACELPFEDDSFDAISCRLGFMFFPDMKLAAREMLRVLRPGGKIAATVWAEPQKNFWITAMIGVLKKYVELPAPDPQGPGLFRCAAPSFLTNLFTREGAEGGVEKEINGDLSCRSATEYWQFMNDVVPPVVSSLRNVSDKQRQMIQQEICQILGSTLSGTTLKISYGARLFSVTKPE